MDIALFTGTEQVGTQDIYIGTSPLPVLSAATAQTTTVRFTTDALVIGENVIKIYVESDPNAALTRLQVDSNLLATIFAAGTNYTKIDGGKIWAGSQIQIGNLDGVSDYCLISDGDLNFYQYINGEHHAVKTLKNIASGVAVSGEWTQLPGRWASLPTIVPTLNNVMSFSVDYISQSQSIRVEITDVTRDEGTGICMFKGNTIVETSDGNTIVSSGVSGSAGSTTATSSAQSLPSNTRKVTATARFRGCYRRWDDGDYNSYYAVSRVRLLYLVSGDSDYTVGDWSPTQTTHGGSYWSATLSTPTTDADITSIKAEVQIYSLTNTIWQLYITGNQYECAVILDSLTCTLVGGSTISDGTFNYLAIAA